MPYTEISAAAHIGTSELVYLISSTLAKLPPVTVYQPEYVEPEARIHTAEDVTVEKKDGLYFVEGQWLLKIMRSINFSDEESMQYFQRVLRNSGIIQKLIDMGVKEGDTVCIYDFSFDFVF